MSHDQLSKSLISTFFQDFLRLTIPDSEPLLHSDATTFVDKELFIDWPQGRRRELDLLAQVPMGDGGAPLLVHVEIESEASATMNQRLWMYYMQIRLRHDLLVLPILVNLRGGRPGVGLEILEEGIEPLATGTFRYRVLGLSGCEAEDWLTRPEPVAWAFAALMRPGKWSPAELKLHFLRRVAAWGVTGFRKEVLVNWIETYVQLSEEESALYQRLLEQEENKEVEEMELTWLGKAEAKGVEKGIEKGVAQAVEHMRRAVLQRVEQRFGVLPEDVADRILTVDSIDPLLELLDRLPLAKSADELVSGG